LVTYDAPHHSYLAAAAAAAVQIDLVCLGSRGMGNFKLSLMGFVGLGMLTSPLLLLLLPLSLRLQINLICLAS
jgi:hypothetical protein